MSIQLSSIMAMFLVHKRGKLENCQFLAKMHQIAPNCISNSKIFPGVTVEYIMRELGPRIFNTLFLLHSPAPQGPLALA